MEDQGQIQKEETSDLSQFLNLGEKGSDSIVFQLGSHSVKFGLASQLQPFVIPNCIAYKKIIEDDDMIIDSESNKKDSGSEINDEFLSNLINMEQDIIKKLAKLEHKFKGKPKMSINKPNIKVLHILN